MNPLEAEVPGKALAQRVALEYEARQQFDKKSPSLLVEALSSIPWVGICVYSAAEFEAPFIVKLVFISAISVIPSLCVQLFYLRRRFNAALVLLGLSSGER